ncbi:MAG TPA: glycosyltransferase family 39 protein [Terriglobales bacterium]|nr:glycosyltransferase family 39 protein [Terriglobales bacterium]
MFSSPSWRDARRSPLAIGCVALALRIGYIVLGHTYQFKTLDDNFSFGYEMGRIGYSLALGQGFSNPFHGITGPTAWEPPLYPLLIAGVFRIFGIYTAASALVLLSLNSLLAALTTLPIFSIAKRSFGEQVAVWSAWTWALLPSAIFWSTRWVWETSLAALLLALLFALALALEARDGLKPWLVFALVWAIAALTNAALLSLLPIFTLWAWYRRAKQGRRSLAGVLAASAVFVVCLAPWLVRNYRTFGRIILVRSNFGAELRLGNGPGADGKWMDSEHPSKNAKQLELYREMGEIAYVAERKREALAFIRQDYARFAWLSVRRFAFFWGGPPHPRKSATLLLGNLLYLGSSLLALFGLIDALGKHRPGAWLFFWVMLIYPLVYYVLFFLPRYRHPIEPELGILMLYAIREAVSRRRLNPESGGTPDG